MKARRGLAVCLILIFCLAIGAASSAANNVELTFWSWRTEDIDGYNKFIQAFEAENPGIKVKYLPFKNTEYDTILATSLQGGAGPDIIHLRPGVEALADSGYLLELNTTSVPELAKFPEDILRGAVNRHTGKIYGVPFAIQIIQVIYNKTIFDEIGLEEPTTWDEFLKICQAVKDKGYVPLANGGKDSWTLETLFGGVAPNLYGGNNFANAVIAGETTFEDERFVYSLEKMLELRPYMPEGFMAIGYTDMQMMFAQEMAAMMIGGSYETITFERLNPDLKAGVFPVPGEKEEGGDYVAVYMDGSYGINATTKHKEACLKFINFLASPEYGQMFTDELSQPSAIPGVRPKHPLLAEMMLLWEQKSTPHLLFVAFRFEQVNGSALLQANLQAMFSDKLTPEKVASEIHEGLSKWYEPFQK